jgi:hypothetical protein
MTVALWGKKGGNRFGARKALKKTAKAFCWKRRDSASVEINNVNVRELLVRDLVFCLQKEAFEWTP